MNSEYHCNVYIFDSDHGQIWVTRISPKAEPIGDIMIDFPDRMMQEHPEFRRMRGVMATEFVDDRNG